MTRPWLVVALIALAFIIWCMGEMHKDIRR